METRAVTLAQQQRILEAVGLVAAISRTDLTAHQRILVAAAKRLLREFAEANEHAGECTRQIAGIAEFTSAPPMWSVRKVIRLTRDPLATLVNPVIRGKARDSAECAVLAVIRSAPPQMLGSHEHPNVTVRHQLGVAKTSALWDLVAEYGGMA